MPDETLRDEERRAREEALKGASLADSVGECRKLIKDLERSRYKAEAIQVGYFASLSLFSLCSRSLTAFSLSSRSLTSLSFCYIRSGTSPCPSTRTNSPTTRYVIMQPKSHASWARNITFSNVHNRGRHCCRCMCATPRTCPPSRHGSKA